MSPDLIFVGLIFVALFFHSLQKKYGLFEWMQSRPVSKYDGSLLLAYYTKGNQLVGITSAHKGKLAYRYFLTMPDAHGLSGDPMFKYGATIYSFELDFNIQTRIIGLGNQATVDKIKLGSYFASNKLDKIELEGDFNNFFSLFAPKKDGTRVRYVLDPSAMQASIDYCQHNFWEVVGDELYVVVSRHHTPSVDVIKQTQHFIDQIRPAVTRTGSDEQPVHHEASYGRYEHLELACPICKATMTVKDNMHVCPKGHGVLLAGKELIELRKGALTLQLPTASPVEHEQLVCPHCGGPMWVSNYQGSASLIIDSCTNCPFRWLDAGEIERVRA